MTKTGAVTREETEWGPLLEPPDVKADEETADIHRIAHELVRTGGKKLARWVERRGRAFSARNESCHAGECERSTGSHQGDTQNACPAGQRESQTFVVGVVQA